VGPRTSLDAVEKRNSLALLGLEPRLSIPYPVAIATEVSHYLRYERGTKNACDDCVHCVGGIATCCWWSALPNNLSPLNKLDRW
jgi:hypothetical protein